MTVKVLTVLADGRQSAVQKALVKGSTVATAVAANPAQ
jgi:hypothetical protein